MNAEPESKTFPLRALLTVTTGRFLMEPKDDRDNGIGGLYELLGWMTGENPFTHQLPRFAEECEPWLLRWFPELGPASVSLASLDRWIASDRTDTKQEGVRMWIAELKMMFPAIKDEYGVFRIPREDHERKDALQELSDKVGADRIIIVDRDTPDPS